MAGNFPHTSVFRNIRTEALICLFLVAATFSVYRQVSNHEFVSYDDGLYVTENLRVQAGLTLNNIFWAFTTTHASNWHPLTWLSHMLDVSIWGLNPGSHHLTNLLFHMANSLLLFLVLRKMSGAVWQSGFVAALFALHPLHVESVAWVSERKDVLSTFFLLLSVWSYVRYVKETRGSGYLAAWLFFILGLMAKPMLVTLPFALLLLDYWPLRRLQFTGFFQLKTDNKALPAYRLLIEKIPFFIFAAASSIVTFYAQKSGGSVESLEVYPLGVRVANALVSYVSYLEKMFWPANLAAYYPHPISWPAWRIAGSSILMISICILCVRTLKRMPYLSVGWLWYLGTLVPVIGLVQVGGQAMADRYTYVPLIGIFIMLVWGLPDLIGRWRYRKIGLAVASAMILIACMIVSGFQIRHWANNIAFYEHVIEVTKDNHMAHYNLGVYLAEQNRITEAIEHYREAIRIKPRYVEAHNNLANALVVQGKLDEAIVHYNYALNLAPQDPEIHNNLGVALIHTGKADRAIDQFNIALNIKPDYIEAHKNLQKALKRASNNDR